MKFDFHLHSYYSDGRISPAEIVRESKKIELEVISLTDHENVDGVPEAIETGQELGLKVIPGIEFAAADLEGKEQHLLGLFIDYKSQELKSFLEIWRKTKVEQVLAIIKNLQAKGCRVEFDEVAAQAKGSLNLSHIRFAVFERKENIETLKRLGIDTPRDFVKKLLNSDYPETVYVEREKPKIEEVTGLIRRIGGMAIWAHPFWKKQGIGAIGQKCRIFQALGLEGLEVCYNRNFSTREMVLDLHRIAQELGLYETAGSDFHSFTMPEFHKIADFDTFGLDLKLPTGGRG